MAQTIADITPSFVSTTTNSITIEWGKPEQAPASYAIWKKDYQANNDLANYLSLIDFDNAFDDGTTVDNDSFMVVTSGVNSANRTATITGLTNGYKYAFRVAGFDATGTYIGCSKRINIVCGGRSVDLSVKNVQAVVSGSNQITVTWDKTNDATGYAVIGQKLVDSTWQYIPNSTLQAATRWLGMQYHYVFNEIGASNGQQYRFAVQANCADPDPGASMTAKLYGSFSPWKNCTYYTDAIITSYVDFTAYSPTPKSILVTWTPINGATHYDIQYRKKGDTEWITKSGVTASQSPYPLTALIPNTVYQIQVYGKKNSSTGPSNMKECTTKIDTTIVDTDMLYPPILPNTLPAFTMANVPGVTYEVPVQQNIKNVGHIQVSISHYNTNLTALNKTNFPDGIYYYTDPQLTTVQLSPNTLLADGQFLPGRLYKIQMRFGSAQLLDTMTFKQKKAALVGTNFSDWSNVLVIKCIDEPELVIKNSKKKNDSNNQNIETEVTRFPEFKGYSVFTERSKEFEARYRFHLYEGLESEELPDTPFLDSGWKEHKSKEDDYCRFKEALTYNEIYTLIYEIESVNGYKKSERYYFRCIDTKKDAITNIGLKAIEDAENGRVLLSAYSKNGETLTGNFMLSRTSDKSDFNIYEDLSYLTFVGDKDKSYIDYTIESGVCYKYALYRVYKGTLLRSKEILEEDFQKGHTVNFEYAYLYRDGVQLKLEFNNQITSFKHTLLRNKQDTLGSKFPHISQNGNAKYAEFQLSGLISFQEDEDITFFVEGDDGYYYNGERVIGVEKFAAALDQTREQTCETYSKPSFEEGENPKDFKYEYIKERGEKWKHWKIDHNLTADNVYVERKFRECVEDFLNGFDCKLFKSPTEGNIVVQLMNVSLQPEQKLGRMIYSFQATAYEVFDNTIDNLSLSGIINPNGFKNKGELVAHLTQFGQFNNIEQEVNVMAELRDLYNTSGDGDVKRTVTKIKWLRVSPADTEVWGDLKVWFGENYIVVPAGQTYVAHDITSAVIPSIDSPHVLIDYICEIEECDSATATRTTDIHVNFDFGQMYQVFDSDIIATLMHQITEGAENMFVEITALDLEFEPGTEFILNGDQHIFIGETGRYSLNDLDSSAIVSLEPVKPVAGLISYECQVIDWTIEEATQ